MAVLKSSRRSGDAGFTLIDLLFCCSLIGLLSTLAIPGLMRAKGVAQAASAVGTLRVINSAQLSYAVTCGTGFYAPDLPTLGVKPPASFQAFLPEELSSGATFIKSGFTFSMSGTAIPGAPASCNGLAVGLGSPGYVAVSDPIDPVGNPHFYGTNAEGVIFEDGTSFAGSIPESGPVDKGKPIH